MSSQIITVCVGQCGITMGDAVTQQYAVEHMIGPDGCPINLKNINAYRNNVFTENSKGYYHRNCIFVDLEHEVIDKTLIYGYQSNLYSPENMIANKEAGSDNYIRGHYTAGKEVIDTVLESLRKQVESSDFIQGNYIYLYKNHTMRYCDFAQSKKRKYAISHLFDMKDKIKQKKKIKKTTYSI